MALAGNELCKFSGERNLRRLRQVQQRNLVEHVGQPLALLLPVQVHAPDGVVQRFFAHAHLRGQRLFREVLQRTAQLEILREVVGPVHTHHRLAHLPVVCIALVRRIHLRAGIQDALVDDGHLTRTVVHRIVRSLGQRHTAGSHLHTALRHVVGTQRNDVGRRAAELSHQHKLVLLGNLLCHGLRRVVQLREGIAGSLLGTHAFRHQIVIQILAERFGSGEEHTAIRHRVAIHVVEATVRVGLHVVVQSVGTQRLDEQFALHLRLGNVGQVHTGRVALELHVQAELVFLHRRSQVIDVFHHQVPVALRGIVRRVLQCLHVEGLRHVGDVRRKFTHLERLAAVGIFIGHGQHLVGLQSGAQRDVAQRCVHRVLRRRQQAGALQFLVVRTAHEAADAVEHGRRLGDVAGLAILVHQRAILRVGIVRRHRSAHRRPYRVRNLLVLAQVGQGNDVSRVVQRSRLVGHPQLHTVDLHARGQVGQRLHAGIVAVAEVL